MVFDSSFDQYRGVIANVALFDGVVSKGDRIVSAHTQKTYEVNEVGILNPNEQPTGKLGCLICKMGNYEDHPRFLVMERSLVMDCEAWNVPYRSI